MYSSEMVATVATLMHIAAFLWYNQKILQGKAHPNTATWAIWAAESSLNFGSYLVMSDDWVKSLLPAASSLLCIATFGVAIRVGKFSHIDHCDLAALGIGLIAVLAWWWFRSAAYANLIMQASIGVGFWPTYRSVWKKPANETPFPWLLWGAAYTVGTVMVVQRWRGQWLDLTFYVVSVFLHLGIGILALRSDS